MILCRHTRILADYPRVSIDEVNPPGGVETHFPSRQPPIVPECINQYVRFAIAMYDYAHVDVRLPSTSSSSSRLLSPSTRSPEDKLEQAIFECIKLLLHALENQILNDDEVDIFLLVLFGDINVPAPWLQLQLGELAEPVCGDREGFVKNVGRLNLLDMHDQLLHRW